MNELTKKHSPKLISFKQSMVEPNWDYFINAPLDQGTIRFETKTERALHARVVAAEANWMQYKTCEQLSAYWSAKHDLAMYREGRNQSKQR